MSKADDMFEKLGYKFTDIDFDIEFHRYEYTKDTELERGIRHQAIWFDLNTKELYIHNSITMQELQAINEKVKELGWLNDT